MHRIRIKWDVFTIYGYSSMDIMGKTTGLWISICRTGDIYILYIIIHQVCTFMFNFHCWIDVVDFAMSTMPIRYLVYIVIIAPISLLSTSLTINTLDLKLYLYISFYYDLKLKHFQYTWCFNVFHEESFWQDVDSTPYKIAMSPVWMM